MKFNDEFLATYNKTTQIKLHEPTKCTKKTHTNSRSHFENTNPTRAQ